MKKALIIIGAIIALALIVAAILPSSAHVERRASIKAPVEVIFDQVNDLKKNLNWSPWVEYDPDMKIVWGEITRGVGASYSWSGNSDVGTGTITMVESIENEFIKNDLDFGDMGKGVDTWYFETVFIEDDNGDLYSAIDVIWAMDSELDWPVGRYFGLFMDGMVGPDFEKGLANLKEVAESMPLAPKHVVNEVQVTEMRLLSVKDSCSIEDIESKMKELMGELYEFLMQNELETSSAPLCIYPVWNTEEGYTVMEVALPISPDVEIIESDRIGVNTLSAGSAAQVIHYGSYASLNSAHFALDEWITDNGKNMSGPPWEVYLSNPHNEPDTSKWITEVYYPFL